MNNTNTLIKENFGQHLIIAGHPKDVNPLALTLENIGAFSGRVLDMGAPETFVYFLTTEKDFVHGLSMAKTIADTSDRFKGVKGGAIDHYRGVVREILNNIPVEDFYPKQGILAEHSIDRAYEFEGNKRFEQEDKVVAGERHDDIGASEIYA
jgi:hypothetical protein